MKLKILRIFSITVIYTLLKICMSDRRHQQGILGCHVTDLTIISGFPEIFRSWSEKTPPKAEVFPAKKSLIIDIPVFPAGDIFNSAYDSNYIISSPFKGT